MLGNTRQKNVDVKIIERSLGNCLVANFRESVPPMTWQLALGSGNNFAVALRGREDDCTLGLIEPKGEFITIARFDNRADAEEAYVEVQKAMMKRRFRTVNGFWSWVLSIVIAIIIIVAVQGAISLLIGSKKDSEVTSGQSLTSSEPKIGEPVPADEILGR